MKLTVHLEHVIGLVDRQVAYSKIKLSLLAMHEEIEGYEQAAANQVALNREHSEATVKIEVEHAQAIAALKQEHAQAIADLNKKYEELCLRYIEAKSPEKPESPDSFFPSPGLHHFRPGSR